MDLRSGDALLIVDMQNDFCPGGALGVPEGDQIIPELNDLMAEAARLHIPVFATRDWHPSNHISFKQRGGIWPPHCIQETFGAEFHSRLEWPKGTVIVSKATGPDTESYSAFGDTDLAQRLRTLNIERIWVAGLALDYCVKETALDGKRLGFDVHVLEGLTRSVNVAPDDGRQAVATMTSSGVMVER